jgi:hypothetical protein
MRAWNPTYEKTRDYATVEEAKGFMISLNSAIKQVTAKGEGSSRKLSFSVSDGEYRVSASDDSVIYTLEPEGELFSPGMSKKEGDLYIEAYQDYNVKIKLNYTSMDIITDNRWASGSHNLVVKNNGTSSGKSEIVFDLT